MTEIALSGDLLDRAVITSLIDSIHHRTLTKHVTFKLLKSNNNNVYANHKTIAVSKSPDIHMHSSLTY